MIRWLAVGLCVAMLGGCSERFWQGPYYERIRGEKAYADILELYRECLIRKQSNVRVDCSEFRTAIEIRDRR